MRIAMLTNNHFPPREGIAQHVKALATRLQARGHEVQIVARGLRGKRWKTQSCEGLAVNEFPYLPLKPFHHLATGRFLQPWLDSGAGGADLIHVHLPLF
ncbi:MAG: glycosyltransferase, partial [Pseudomonadota bacterium]